MSKETRQCFICKRIIPKANMLVHTATGRCVCHPEVEREHYGVRREWLLGNFKGYLPEYEKGADIESEIPPVDTGNI